MTATPAWEQSKENAAPLERGRNVAELEGVGLPRRNEIDLRIQQFEQLVHPSEHESVTAMEGDPIVHWTNYIKFYQESFPTDTNQVILLLERCTRALSKMRQYSDDERFVSMCIHYAGRTREPGRLFKELHSRKVGQKLALFYAGWAFVAESSRDFQLAKKILEKGISKGAEPLDLLKTRRHQFERRMARHLRAQTSPQTSEYYADDEEPTQRAALVGLSSHGARRSQLSTSRLRPRDHSSRGTLAARHNVEASGTSFPIFVEPNGENDAQGYNFEQSFLEVHGRPLAKDADRKKENVQGTERWNDRGGLPSVKGSMPSSYKPQRSGPPSFSVFVDEECISRQNEEAHKQNLEARRRRCERDERTFRPRKVESVSEKLLNNPVMYIMDPSQLETDRERQTEGGQLSGMMKGQSKRKVQGRFHRLLKNEIGLEQTFEEARAAGTCFKAVSARTNFNHLHVAKIVPLKNSKLEIDEDLSSIEGESVAEVGTPRGWVSMLDDGFHPTNRSSRTSKQVILDPGVAKPEVSFEAGVNQTLASAASSTVNEALAAGLPLPREEQTINTKFAYKELSMMFSSPVPGEDAAARPKSIKSPSSSNAGDEFGQMAELVGNLTLDNSIVGAIPVNVENVGPRNPVPRTTDSPEFPKIVLRELQSDIRESADLGCQRQTRLFRRPLEQHDPLRGAEVELSDDPGFRIFEDTEVAAPAKEQSQPMFPIFRDADAEPKIPNENPPSGGVELAPSGFAIHDGDPNRVCVDTAKLSVVGKLSKGVDEVGTDTESCAREALVESDNIHCSVSAVVHDKIAIENSQPDINPFLEAVVCPKGPITSYDDKHNNDSKGAFDWIKKVARLPAFDRHTSLGQFLSMNRQVFDMRDTKLPRLFSLKQVPTGNNIKPATKIKEVNIGELTGIVRKQLGWGSYGIVLLMNGSGENPIAVKAQQDFRNLSWEYRVLSCLQERIDDREKLKFYPFPRPYSFVLLKEAGLMGMTAASTPGLNLVDLGNVYRFNGNPKVPDLLVLHYTARMVNHVDMMHRLGKILHCDVKPDNFVLCKSESSDNICKGMDASEVMLVDFGRAIDLSTFNHSTSVRLSGEAAGKDMECVAMREGNPWSFDADAFGILCSAHVLLFGEHLKIVKGRDGKWTHTRAQFQREWRDLWEDVYEQLLNFNQSVQVSNPKKLRKLNDQGTALKSGPRNLRNISSLIEVYLNQHTRELEALMRKQRLLLHR